MDNYLILIIDDDQTYHVILEGYLRASGYEVIHAKDGSQGLKIMETQKPDLVLLDIQMPVMDGFKTLELIRKKKAFRDIPVFLLTSLVRETLKIKGLELGADDYITKPFNREEVLARIKAALRRVTRDSRSKGVMEGNLSDLGLSDLLQSMELGSKTASIFMKEIDGDIFIENGSLVHVRQGNFTGEQALIRIFLLEQGAFSVRFGELPPDIAGKGAKPLMSVLMGVLAEVDETEDIISRMGVENQLIKIDDNISDFPALEKFKAISPISFINLLVLMEGEVKNNLKILIMASKKGKLKIVR
ncbi:response regulator [Desulfonema magnum]|uniref:response regulator n=1 Tax=Desulfonema magnum TaxID=45655 RepID=UPI001A9B8098|nr:response regulator [Desulfonema magnum]